MHIYSSENPRSLTGLVMANRVFCGNCGGAVRLPEGYVKAKIRCDSCGYYAEVPMKLRAKEPTPPEPQTPFDEPTVRKAKPEKSEEYQRTPGQKPRPTRDLNEPHDHRAKFEEDSSVGLPLLAGDDNETDDIESVTPYAVPGTGLKPCPHCRGELPLDAVFCVHCGTDLIPEGPSIRPKREYTPRDRTWGEGWSMGIRLQILLVLQIANIALLIVTGISRGDVMTSPSVILVNVIANVIHTALQAFLLGTYDSIRFTRNERGKCQLWRTRRIAFVPMKPMKLSLKSHAGVGVLPWHNPGIFAWLLCLYLLICGIFPAVLFYFVVIRPDRFHVAFCNEYKGVEEHIFRTKNLELATEIAKTIADATALRFYKVL